MGLGMCQGVSQGGMGLVMMAWMMVSELIARRHDEDLDLISLDDLCAWAALYTSNHWHLLTDHSLDAMLDAFDHLDIAFRRKAHGMVTCVVTTYYGDTYRAVGADHVMAGYRAIYKTYNNMGGRVRYDNDYQRYV